MAGKPPTGVGVQTGSFGSWGGEVRVSVAVLPFCMRADLVGGVLGGASSP